MPAPPPDEGLFDDDDAPDEQAHVDRMRVELFTDGACSGNPGPGGWAWILKAKGVRPKEDSGGEPETTNNRMELLSVINGLRALKRPCRVTSTPTASTS